MVPEVRTDHITVPVGHVDDIIVEVPWFIPENLMVRSAEGNEQCYGQANDSKQSAVTKIHAGGTVTHTEADDRVVKLSKLEMHLDNWTDDSVTFKIDGNTLVNPSIVQFLITGASN